MNMWLVGQYRAETEDGPVWDYQGTYSTRERALAACRTPDYFIMATKLDAEVPHEAELVTVEYPYQQLPSVAEYLKAHPR